MVKINTIWLPKEVFEWNQSSAGGAVISSNSINRAYIIWEHSRVLIEEATNDLQLSDGILNLKRSLNQRLKLIEDTYSFKKIDILNKPKGYLELLERYGIVRPYLMKNLLTIRNDIEHNDAPPPDINRCKELLDVVWYFLKSTDGIVQLVKEAIFDLFDNKGRETNYGFQIEIDYDTTPISIKLIGWFPSDLLSNTSQQDYFQVFVEIFHGKEHWGNDKYHEDKLDTDKWIIASIDIRTIELEKIINKVMTAY
ncbi:hypothetical protein [Cohnella sp. WQ 127256]|uniref:hypothetical protein n=1 Tax=Cohnella sp. WQ 127256 TaxID=2938790 RepID=UPI0021198840|nr:hypothetical protein [Cohnella sp. WQ 127256]